MQALLSDALLAYLTGDVASIWARGNEIVDIAPGNEDHGSLALALVLRGFVRALLGLVDEGNETAQDVARGMAVAERCGIEWVQAEIAMTLGQFSRADGNPEAALAHLDRAEELARQFGHRWAECSTQWVRAKVYIELGQGPAALRAVAATTLLAHDDGDRTSALAGLLTAAGAATAAGNPRVGAVLLGATETLSRLVGYDPLRMDPVDGQRYVASTRAALPPDEYEAALAEGRTMDMAAAIALVQRLAGRSWPAPVTGSVSAP
jgi:hypothetical protein